MKNKYNKGFLSLTTILIFIVIAFGASIVFGASPIDTGTNAGEAVTYTPDTPSTNVKRNSLQIDSLKFSKLELPVTTPGVPISSPPGLPPGPLAPTNECMHNTMLADRSKCSCSDAFITCSGTICVDVDGPADCDDLFDNYCWLNNTEPNQSAYICLAKPIIYLYPVQETNVDVRVETSGKVVVSDPLYPPEGWRDVTAFPDGRLIYNGKEYRELFYETENESINAPKEAIIIAKNNIDKELEAIIKKLGLSDFEANEFLEYWIPRLKDEINTPYISFSILDKIEKARLDKVIVTPVPDTRIEFIAYFKPVGSLSAAVNIKPLILPPKPPERTGFTFVEWGGTIDRN